MLESTKEFHVTTRILAVFFDHCELCGIARRRQACLYQRLADGGIARLGSIEEVQHTAPIHLAGAAITRTCRRTPPGDDTGANPGDRRANGGRRLGPGEREIDSPPTPAALQLCASTLSDPRPLAG